MSCLWVLWVGKSLLRSSSPDGRPWKYCSIDSRTVWAYFHDGYVSFPTARNTRPFFLSLLSPSLPPFPSFVALRTCWNSRGEMLQLPEASPGPRACTAPPAFRPRPQVQAPGRVLQLRPIQRDAIHLCRPRGARRSAPRQPLPPRFSPWL